MLKYRVGFARTFSITSFMFYGPGQMNKDLWILYVMVSTCLLTSWSSITSSITRRAKLISIQHVVAACPTSCHSFAWVFYANCFCASNFCRLCSSHNCLSSSLFCLCRLVLVKSWPFYAIPNIFLFLVCHSIT
jgi:hypothetical protein